MTGQHARRYSRIREWRGVKAAATYKPRHRKTEAMMLGDTFDRAIRRMMRSMEPARVVQR